MASKQIITDVTKPWKRQFFDTKEIEPGEPPKTIIRPAEHGILKKDKRNANINPRTRH
jgi:hypothetical protein